MILQQNSHLTVGPFGVEIAGVIISPSPHSCQSSAIFTPNGPTVETWVPISAGKVSSLHQPEWWVVMGHPLLKTHRHRLWRKKAPGAVGTKMAEDSQALSGEWGQEMFWGPESHRADPDCVRHIPAWPPNGSGCVYHPLSLSEGRMCEYDEWDYIIGQRLGVFQMSSESQVSWH